MGYGPFVICLGSLFFFSYSAGYGLSAYFDGFPFDLLVNRV